VCQAEQQGGGGPQQDSASDQVYAHNVGPDNDYRFTINDHDVKGVASGVTTGSIDYSANREVLITDVLITPGEGQSSGDGAQDGATVYRQPSKGPVTLAPTTIVYCQLEVFDDHATAI
jgi:hypothetical protein